jgi:hypothetical protein
MSPDGPWASWQCGIIFAKSILDFLSFRSHLISDGAANRSVEPGVCARRDSMVICADCHQFPGVNTSGVGADIRTGLSQLGQL